MAMRLILGTAMVACAIGLGACESKETQPVKEDVVEPLTPDAADADERFAYAAIYECGGLELKAVFNHGDGRDTLVKAGDGAAMVLRMPEDADQPAWTDGTRTFTDMGGDATWQDGSAAPVTCRGVSRALPPPKAAGVARDLTIDDAGARVELKTGDRFSISLSDVPTAGYQWSGVGVPAFLKQVDELGGATTTSQFLPGYAGGNHWIVLVFEATATGNGELELVQKRPWEDTPDPDDKRFKLTVSVK
jgi:predicted secreted protein